MIQMMMMMNVGGGAGCGGGGGSGDTSGEGGGCSDDAVHMMLMTGGFDDNSPLDCVERYNPVTSSWSMVAHMSCPRGGVGIVALGGKLYAVGGHDGSNYLSSVEEYDPTSDR